MMRISRPDLIEPYHIGRWQRMKPYVFIGICILTIAVSLLILWIVQI